ncbi:MAG: DUF3488 and transglutaminase-like domain-containing protein, partial [Actinomycetota bacterium]|nr:DUF3488 and transglutaminase-like domain-containing protein [Actinomycetota bacterium]
MVRTLVSFALVAALVGPAWLRLDGGDFPLVDLVVLLALALVPTLAVALRRPRWVVAVAAAGTTLVAGSVAFGISIADARPGDGAHDFFGPVASSFRQGLLDFFDTAIPFNPVDFPEMRGVVLFGAFAFVAFAGVAIAARRVLLALAALLVGAGWPATMASTWLATSRPLLTGALILAAALALLFLLGSGTRGVVHAAAVGLLLVAVSVGFSTSDAVAKRGFVDWDSWDFYDRPDDPVSVRYVWDSNYDGIHFPEKRTVVLRIKVEGPRRSLYWRATTLDEYTGQIWREALDVQGVTAGESRVDVRDPLLPPEAREEDAWIRQEVEVEGLRDTRLVGYGEPVRWEPRASSPARVASNGALVLGESPRRGHRYTVWSYAPRLRPQDLAKAGTHYPDEASRYLVAFPTTDAAGGPLSPFGAPRRDADMRSLFKASTVLDGGVHRRLWTTARRVTRGAETPYAAAVLLETWFRGSEGNFVYDESPPVATAVPPLVAFLENKRGYCQHFAGAMALMLRYLGIPARVAAGFTSGQYDEDENEWTVTDHNAHTWVEVYFPGNGWVPFDPTPNRGE